MVTMRYNGVDFSNLIDIKAIRRSVGNGRSISSDDAPKIGVNVKEVEIEGKTIEIDFSIVAPQFQNLSFVDPNETSNVSFGNINKQREEIAGYFHQLTPKRLTLSDEPDRYYLAMPVGEIDLDGIQTYYDEATVSFFVPDGVAHSSTYKLIEEQTDYVDKSVIDIRNDGTVDAYPIITIKHTAENGYVGIVNQQSVMEVGNRNEADTVKGRRSEMLLDYKSKSDGTARMLIDGAQRVGITNWDGNAKNVDLKFGYGWDKDWISL